MRFDRYLLTGIAVFDTHCCMHNTAASASCSASPMFLCRPSSYDVLATNKVISAALERLSICNLTATIQKLFNAKRSRARKLYKGSMVRMAVLI